MNNDQPSPLNQSTNPEQSPAPTPFQANNPSQPPVSPVPVKRRNKKLIIGIIVAAVIVVLGAGSVLAYNFWYQNPDKVVSDSLVNALKAKSLTFTGSLDMTSDTTKAKIKIDGVAGQAQGSVNVKATFDMEGQQIALNGSGLMGSSGDLYFKVANVKDIVKSYREAVPVESQAIFDQLVAKIDDRWIKISADDMKQFSEDTGTAQKCFNDTLKKFQNDKAAINEVATIYKKNKFLTIEQNLGIKNGSLGYTVKANDNAAKGFAKAFKDTRIFKSLHECDSSFTVDEDKAVDSDKKSTSETRMELWVSQWSHEITKVTAVDETGPDKVSFVFEPVFNKTVNVTVPEKAVTLNELKAEIETLIQSVYTGAAAAQLQS
jgi:hypothetical protein